MDKSSRPTQLPSNTNSSSKERMFGTHDASNFPRSDNFNSSFTMKQGIVSNLNYQSKSRESYKRRYNNSVDKHAGKTASPMMGQVTALDTLSHLSR